MSITQLEQDLSNFFTRPIKRNPKPETWLVRLGSDGQTASEAGVLGTFDSKQAAIEAMEFYNKAHPTTDAYAWFPERTA